MSKKTEARLEALRQMRRDGKERPKIGKGKEFSDGNFLAYALRRFPEFRAELENGPEGAPDWFRRGRPATARSRLAEIRAMKEDGMDTAKIAESLGITRASAFRLLREA